MSDLKPQSVFMFAVGVVSTFLGFYSPDFVYHPSFLTWMGGVGMGGGAVMMFTDKLTSAIRRALEP